MKLVTRIMGICCLAVLAASVSISAIIWGRLRESYLDEAFAEAYRDTAVAAHQLQSVGESRSSVDEVYLEYLLKKENDPYNLCFMEDSQGKGTEIYNRTVFQEEFLMGLDYNSYQIREKPEFYYTYFSWEGRKFIAFQSEIFQGTRFYHLTDITYVEEKMGRLAVLFLLITGAVLLCTMLFLYLVLKKILKPLKELNDSAGQIAEGNYDQRIFCESRDEIGQLSKNFNKMAAAVELRTHRLEESELRKTLFMGNLTHELKTPMTSISGYAQTLLQVKVSEEDRVEALQYIYQECSRLERLSKKMMRLLELDQGTDLPLTEHPVKGVFEAAARSCGVILKEKNLTLDCREQGEAFWMDKDLLQDALVNLIDNAVKASPAGGRIILRAGVDFIEVEDFGKGIPREEQEKILEPFYMVDKSRSRKSGGAGLGLALTALIARIHHCRVEIESEEGKGTKIRLHFV